MTKIPIIKKTKGVVVTTSNKEGKKLDFDCDVVLIAVGRKPNTKNLNLQIPLMSSAMDTVTESKMAIAISKSGGIGIVHRNLSIEKQVVEVQKVKKSNCLVGAEIGRAVQQEC